MEEDWEDGSGARIILEVEGPNDRIKEYIKVVRLKELSDRSIFQGLDSDMLPVEFTIRAMGLDEGVR